MMTVAQATTTIISKTTPEPAATIPVISTGSLAPRLVSWTGSSVPSSDLEVTGMEIVESTSVNVIMSPLLLLPPGGTEGGVGVNGVGGQE